MTTNEPFFRFDNSYLTLPEHFYSKEHPAAFPSLRAILVNDLLCDQLGLRSSGREEAILQTLKPGGSDSFAMAYAGHQFGHFTMLGDGRAIVLGEHLTHEQGRFDVQLKGSGQTLYSRRGDGRATLRAMLREFIVSEAMFALKIPTSRSLALLETGEQVYRESVQKGSALVRVMKSHLRVGTFEYAARMGSTEDLQALTAYTVDRLYPSLALAENPPLELLRQVMTAQIALVVNWMRVGFIHGVMNTDNCSISGESFDYGPCAFLNSYHPDTVYSSIDSNGRYAFGRQPHILKWNIARLAEALLPIIDTDINRSLSLAQAVINEFDNAWAEAFYGMMLRKIGFEKQEVQYRPLVDELLVTMQENKLDYTNTFIYLMEGAEGLPDSSTFGVLNGWKTQWTTQLWSVCEWSRAQEIMKKENPRIIPRNHLVEKALDEAELGKYDLFDQLLKVVSAPYEPLEAVSEWMKPSESSFEQCYKTYCGT